MQMKFMATNVSLYLIFTKAAVRHYKSKTEILIVHSWENRLCEQFRFCWDCHLLKDGGVNQNTLILSLDVLSKIEVTTTLETIIWVCVHVW